MKQAWILDVVDHNVPEDIRELAKKYCLQGEYGQSTFHELYEREYYKDAEGEEEFIPLHEWVIEFLKGDTVSTVYIHFWW